MHAATRKKITDGVHGVANQLGDLPPSFYGVMIPLLLFVTSCFGWYFCEGDLSIFFKGITILIGLVALAVFCLIGEAEGCFVMMLVLIAAVYFGAGTIKKSIYLPQEEERKYFTQEAGRWVEVAPGFKSPTTDVEAIKFSWVGRTDILEAQTKEGKPIFARCDLQFRYSSDKISEIFDADYPYGNQEYAGDRNFIDTTLEEVFQSSASSFTYHELSENRQELGRLLLEQTKKRLGELGEIKDSPTPFLIYLERSEFE